MKWGIIGAGRIANRFCASLQNIKECELYAISCRTSEKALAFAKLHPCKKIYSDYNKIVQDPNIDAVYIATPHQFHYEWIMKCLTAHKAVFVEKPACLTVEQINNVIQCAKENNTLFMEAMKTRFVPLYKVIHSLICDGEIGTLTNLELSLCNEIPQEYIRKSYLGDPDSGGVLTDMGIYALSWLDDFVHEELTLTHLYTNLRDDVLYYIRAKLSGKNVSVTLECGMDRSKPKKAIIRGTKGTITIPDFHRPVTACINDRIIEIPYEYDDFYGEIRHFTELYISGKKESELMSFQSTLNCIKLMQTIQNGMLWNKETVTLLEKEEQNLSFEHLSIEDINRIGEQLKCNQKMYERNAAIRIVDEETDTILFEYLPADKSERNFMFMEGKRNVAKLASHSSLYAIIKHIVNGDYEEMMNAFPVYCPSGGAFPLIADNKWKYTILASGLHEGEDHELIVNTLYKYKNMEIPPFPYRMI